jgi:hypothetical protein
MNVFGSFFLYKLSHANTTRPKIKKAASTQVHCFVILRGNMFTKREGRGGEAGLVGQMPGEL